jgi:hypothetical protein
MITRQEGDQVAGECVAEYPPASPPPNPAGCGPSCLSCAVLLRRFGFELRPPDLSGLIEPTGDEGSAADA